MSCVQRKVIAVNMLIQNDFLKVAAAERWLFFEAFEPPIREHLSTI